MGYSTYFEGKVAIDPPLNAEQIAYIQAFNNTRRMERDPAKAEALDDPVRKAVGLPIGDDAAYFVGGSGFAGQGHDESVINHNGPPTGQPGLWCKWTVTDDGEYIIHDDAEKFYDYVEWMAYLRDHFIKPWGRNLNGHIEWEGEDNKDMGVINVIDNDIFVSEAEIKYTPKVKL